MSCRVFLPSNSFSNMNLVSKEIAPSIPPRFNLNSYDGFSIVAPLPRKTLSLRAAGLPRLGTGSPSPRIADSELVCPPHSMDQTTLSDCSEMSSDSEVDQEMDAYTELFEIIESAVPNSRLLHPISRVRNSSVPTLFGDNSVADKVGEFDTPTLCPTPCRNKVFPRPIQIQKDFVPDVTMVVGSPVFRTRNPVPNNSPFRGYGLPLDSANRPAILARMSFPSDNESDDENVLEILSPSPVSFKEDLERRRRTKSMNAIF